MACQAMESWTLSGLVGAFLDLAIAYLLLCESTLACFASKFLGFFGLSLPCPCNGVFGTPNSNYCMERLLVDYPLEIVAFVHLSLKNKFPFHLIWVTNQNYQLNLNLIRDRDKNGVEGFQEMEGEASCSSMSGSNVGERDLVVSNESAKGIDVRDELVHAKGGFDIKGKRTVTQRPSSSLRRQRKICVDSPVLSLGLSCGDAESNSSVNCGEKKAIECSALPVDTKADAGHFNDDDKSPSSRNFGEKSSSLSINFNELSFAEIKCNLQKKLGYGGNEKNVIRLLKQALEEVCLDLEKERNAATSAMDAAMVMILRLQKDKASVEMKARHQRLIREKSTYDAKDTNILKEIIVSRETEKSLLEKEIEFYWQLYSGNEQLQDDILDIVNT